MPDNKDVALRITADGQQMSKVVDMLQQQINTLRQSASNIPIGGSAGGGAGSGASNPGGSHSAAGIAANSATNAPSNPGRGATNGAQMPRVTQTAAGSAATPAALSTMPAPSRSGGGRTVGNGATQVGGSYDGGGASSVIGGGGTRRGAPAGGMDDDDGPTLSQQLQTGRQRARQAGYGPATNLRTRRVVNDPQDQFDDDGQPRSPLNQAWNRFSNSGYGRYGRQFGRGALVAIGRSAQEYFQMESQEELTGRRNYMGGLQVAGSTIGGLAGAGIGAAFGGFGSVIGAGIGGQVGQQAAVLSMAGAWGANQRMVGNAGLTAALGYAPGAMEQQSQAVDRMAWQPNWRPGAGQLNGFLRRLGAPGNTVADWFQSINRSTDPNAPNVTDVMDDDTDRRTLASLGLAGGRQYSLGDMGNLLSSHNTKATRANLIAQFKRLAIEPQNGYNQASEFMAMGPEGYFSSFDGQTLPDAQRQSMLTSYRNIHQSAYNVKIATANAGTAGAMVQNALQSGQSIGTQQATINNQMSQMQSERSNLQAQAAAWAQLPGGASTPEYAQLMQQIAGVDSNMIGLGRSVTTTLHSEAMGAVGIGNSRAAQSIQRNTLFGNSNSLLANEGISRRALGSELGAEQSYLARMRQGGFTIGEIDAQQAHVIDIQSKIQGLGAQVAGQWMGRFQMESGGRMSSIGLHRFMAQNYGSFSDIQSGVAASNAERSSLISGLRGRMGSMSSTDRIAAQQVIDQAQQGIEQDNIGLRDTALSRNADRIGLLMQPAQRAMAEAGRKGGVGAYRSAASGVLGVLGEEAGDIDSQIAMGGLTYDQATRLNKRRNEIRQEQDATSWEALTGGISRRNAIAANQVRGSGQAMLNALGTAYGEYQQAGVAGDSPIFAELNTQRRAAQQTAYRQQDILSYNLPMAQMNAQEAIRQNMPFSPGYGLGMAMQRAGLRSGYINQRIGRYRSDMAHGDLSEEEQMGAASDILNLQVEQSRDIGMLARGGPGRIQAMSAGATSYRGRFDSMSLASTALWRSGHPRMDMGFANGGHMAQSQGYFSQFRTDSFDPISVMSPFSKGSGVQSETLQRAMLQALQSINNKMGASGGNPGGGMMAGEARQRMDAALDVTRIDGRRNYGVRQ